MSDETLHNLVPLYDGLKAELGDHANVENNNNPIKERVFVRGKGVKLSVIINDTAEENCEGKHTVRRIAEVMASKLPWGTSLRGVPNELLWYDTWSVPCAKDYKELARQIIALIEGTDPASDSDDKN